MITPKEVELAYRKLKSLAYYDNGNLFLRYRIAKFESDLKDEGDAKTKIEAWFKNISNRVNDEDIEFWHGEFDQLQLRALPKSFDKNTTDETKKEDPVIPSFFENVREKKSTYYKLKRVTLFADASVATNVLSVLWIMTVGHNLEDTFFEKCYGNRLLREEKEETDIKEIKPGLGLFKPYYKQYQRWRDEGIEAARQKLKDKDDIIFVNLDIKDYYHSVRVKKNAISEALNTSDKGTENAFLRQMFIKFHEKYTSHLEQSKYPNDKGFEAGTFSLPIGIPSSYVLANWYLNHFDQKVLSKIKPIYYSRYVDDIFIVLPKTHLETLQKTKRLTPNRKFIKEHGKNPIEREVLYSLSRVLEYTFQNDAENSEQFKFKIKGYDKLYIQPSKTLLYHFDHTSSMALLDKFKEELLERSSEFRFLPDEKLIAKGFSSEAYELIFDDSKGKVKTLKDYKENRYGISSYLAKRIFYTLRNGPSSNQDLADILLFFKGYNNLEYFGQWERLLTLLLINNEYEAVKTFLLRSAKQIGQLEFGRASAPGIAIQEFDVKEDLREHLRLAFHLGYALNPKKYKNGKNDSKWCKAMLKIIDGIEAKNFPRPRQNTAWQEFRFSNMIRQSYVAIPFITYYNMADTDCSLTDIKAITKMATNANSNGGNNDHGLSESNFRMFTSPTWRKFCEIAWTVCWRRINKAPAPLPYTTMAVDDMLYPESGNYLDEAFELFCSVNYHTRSPVNKEELRENIYQYKRINELSGQNIEAHEITVNNNAAIDTLKVGLANLFVHQSKFEQSMLGNPEGNNRFAEFEPILNTAEKEHCNMVVMPELVLPHSSVRLMIEQAWQKQRAIVTGIEHWTVNTVAHNFILTILPTQVNGVKDAVPILRLKNHYSPMEEFWINDYRRVVPKPDPFRYHLLRWKGLYFTDYYCFELGDINHRALFKSKLDFIIASERNKDTNYYSNIAELTARDLHCYFVQVNSSEFGDTRVTRPSKTEIKDSLRIKGGKNAVLLTDELELKKLRMFQYKGFGLEKDDKDFKPTPSGYVKEDVRRRMENKSFTEPQSPRIRIL